LVAKERGGAHQKAYLLWGKTAASRSRGHRWGPRGWGGSTRWRGAWGGVEMIGGGLERAVRGGSGRPERNGDGSLDTGSPASACGP
jgi:hypothetical protein